MHKNVGFILNEIVRNNPTYFTNFSHIMGENSILYLIEIIDENTIRLKKDIRISIDPNVIKDLEANFKIVP